MTIPHTSKQRPGLRRAVLLASLTFGLVSSIFALLLWLGALPGGLQPPSHCPPLPPAATACPECRACGGEGAPAAQTPAAKVTDSSREAQPVVSYRVCDAIGGKASVHVLALGGAGPILGVHCGLSVHLVAFDAGIPRRILRLDRSRPPEGLVAQPGIVASADVDGDAREDLLIGTVLRDAQASPRGGGLYYLRRSVDSSFDDARRLAPLPVSAMATGRLEPSAGEDIAIVQLEDARLARTSDLIVLRGGPAPVKMWTAPAGFGEVRALAIDVDLDGRDELALAGPAAAPELLSLDEQGAVRERTSLELPPAGTLLAGDVDGDGHDDLILAGKSIWVLQASGEPHRKLSELAADAPWASLQVVDWDGDDRLDLIGQHDQAIWALLQKPGARTDHANSPRFEAHQVAALPDPDFAMLALLLIPASRPEWMVVGITTRDERIGVDIQRLNTTGTPLDTRSVAVADAPLSQHIVLP